jgi:hypothetical protein
MSSEARSILWLGVDERHDAWRGRDQSGTAKIPATHRRCFRWTIVKANASTDYAMSTGTLGKPNTDKEVRRVA